MALRMMGPWGREYIPDSDQLYVRVHKTQVQGGRPIPGVFKNRSSLIDTAAPPGMSTDWSEYSTPEATRDRALSSLPEDNGVICLNVVGVRELYKQQVEHSPWYQNPEDPKAPNNRAHTDIIGPKSPKEVSGADERIAVLSVRASLVELSYWAIDPPGV